jgi:hypothetical protein
MIYRSVFFRDIPIFSNMSITRIFMPGLAILSLSACSYVPRIVTEYRIDVQQGNVLSQDMVSQLKPGQTRDQVRFILGTPLVDGYVPRQSLGLRLPFAEWPHARS